MMYADSITKSFLSAGSEVPFSQLDDYQDPTYLGFQFRLVPSLNAAGDFDDLPHGLFTLDPVKDPYSCYNYLISRGESKRAEYILLFESMFRNLVENYPWYFVKVSGLADSWKIDTKNNFRGKEKKIVFDTLESIDMRMTMIMDLYRKAVYDAAYMRWAVPDHMRYFKMEIIVSEIRPMKIGTEGYQKSVFPGPFSSTNTNFAPDVPEMQAKTPGLGLWDTTAPWSPGTFIKFQYSECELEVFAEAPAFLESVGNIPEAPAANKITIHTHVIGESNFYGLLGAIVDDTKHWYDYTSGTGGDGGVYYPSDKGDTSDVVPPELSSAGAGKSIFLYTDGYNDRVKAQETFNSPGNRYELGRSASWEGGDGPSLDNKTGVDYVKDENLWQSLHEPKDLSSVQMTEADGTIRSAVDQVETYFDETHKLTETQGAERSSSAPPGDKTTEAAARSFDQDHKGSLRNTPGNGSPLGSFGRRLTTGAIAAVSNIANNAVNRALLGNVYGVSPLSIIGSAQSILNNPAAAIEAILKKHSSPSIGKELAKKVALTGQEIQLVKSIIGASATGAEDNVKVNSDLVKGQGKVNQESATQSNSNPGKTNLAAPNIKSNQPGKTNLESPTINSNDPGKANLREPNKPVARQENSNLTAFAKAGATPSKVELEGPTILPASAQKENLEGAQVLPAKLGNANLQAPPVEKGKLGKTNFR